MEKDIKDVLIIGGGPGGLFGAYYGALIGLRGMIIESSSVPGGSPKNAYPAKALNNYPGYINQSAGEFSDNLLAQFKTKEDTFPLRISTTVVDVKDDGEIFEVSLSNGEVVYSYNLMLANGTSMFAPRQIEVESDNSIEIQYHIGNFEKYKGKKVSVTGGGNTAVDTATELLNAGAQVTIIHRREDFRAFKDAVSQLEKSGASILTSTQITEINNGKLHLDNNDSIIADALFVCWGNQGKNRTDYDYGIEEKSNKAVVNSKFQTSRERIYAIGKRCTYPGRINIILSATYEAAMAIKKIENEIGLDHSWGY